MGKYITNLAENYIGQFKAKIEPGDYFQGMLNPLANNLYKRHGEAIMAQLIRMNPETLGKIAVTGRGRSSLSTSMYQVHCGEIWLDTSADGATLVLKIACTAIIAEMAEILKRQR